MAYTIIDLCIGCGVCKLVCPVEAIEGLPRKDHRILAARCIDCGACGRICPQGAVKDPAGVVCRRIRLRHRWPKPRISTEDCLGCTVCVQSCPAGCLDLASPGGSRESVRKAVLASSETCIACGFCATDCPVEAIEMIDPEPLTMS